MSSSALVTRRRIFIITVLGFLAGFPAHAADVYGTAATAQTVALGGISLGSSGPTDALASNPAMLTLMDRPYLELTGMGVLARGQFHNSTAYVGALESNAGVSASAAFGMEIPHSRLSIGLGVFPVSLLSDRWRFQDPPGTAGASYGIQSSKSAFIAAQASFGVGFQVSRLLSVGAAFGVLDNLNTLEMPYVFQSNPTLAGLKTLLDLHTRGVGYNGTFGIISEPSRRLRLSLAYKTRTTIRSTGTATGNAYAQFAALGLAYPSGFNYKAEVDNVFPQSAKAGVAWKAGHRLQTYLQVDWLNWRGAFGRLPVRLTDGNNALLNSLLNSTSLNDAVPLYWKNQLTARTGFELPLGEKFAITGAYSYGNSPVPAATLTPLTAAIMTDAVSAGIKYQRNRYRLQLAYQVNLPQTATVARSGLLAGEFSDTSTSIWLQTIALTTGVRF